MQMSKACSALAAGMLTCAVAASAQTSGRTQASAQDTVERDTPITLVGCIQRETEYRREHESGRGGPVATGAGLGNEFVLINASRAGGSSEQGIDCAAQRFGEAYELTGSAERNLTRSVGHYVEITGMLKPMGKGVDLLGQDLKLPEVNVTSFRDAPTSRAEATTAQLEPQPLGTASTAEQLPRTAGPLPLAGLLGLMSLGGALSVRALRRK
jgi:hypothetical protein